MCVECSSNIKVLTMLAPRLHMYGCPSSVSPEAPCSRPQSPRMKILCRPHGLHLSGRPGSCNIPKHDCVQYMYTCMYMYTVRTDHWFRGSGHAWQLDREGNSSQRNIQLAPGTWVIILHYVRALTSNPLSRYPPFESDVASSLYDWQSSPELVA